MRRWILVFGIALLVPVENGNAQERRYEALGQIGGGIFRPTGSDGDVAGTSPAIQLVGAVEFAERLGIEAEFLYVPVQLKSSVFVGADYKKSSQISALVGPRFSSGRLSRSGSGVGHLSVRAGFARIVTRSDIGVPAGGWIGRSVDDIENPAFFASIKARQRGFALSPRAGVLLKIAERSAVDLSVFPLFIFDRGKVTSQLYFTASFALTSMQDF